MSDLTLEQLKQQLEKAQSAEKQVKILAENKKLLEKLDAKTRLENTKEEVYEAALQATKEDQAKQDASDKQLLHLLKLAAGLSYKDLKERLEAWYERNVENEQQLGDEYSYRPSSSRASEAYTLLIQPVPYSSVPQLDFRLISESDLMKLLQVYMDASNDLAKQFGGKLIKSPSDLIDDNNCCNLQFSDNLYEAFRQNAQIAANNGVINLPKPFDEMFPALRTSKARTPEEDLQDNPGLIKPTPFGDKSGK